MKEHKLIAGLLILTGGIFAGMQFNEMVSDRPQHEFVSSVMSEKYGTAAVLNSGKLAPSYWPNTEMSAITESFVSNTPTFSDDQFVNLAVGSTGYNVNILQRVLRSSGYFPQNTEFTEYFGPVTKNALISFQLRNGLGATGVVDSQTSAALANEINSAFLPLASEEDEGISVNQIPDDGVGPPYHTSGSSSHYVGTRNHTSPSVNSWPSKSQTTIIMKHESGYWLCHTTPSAYWDCSL